MNTIRSRYSIGVNDLAHQFQKRIIKLSLTYAEKQQEMSHVLDCPCGSGRFSNLFEDYTLTCADLAEHRLERARENVNSRNTDFVKCDLLELPFEDATFDFILCVFVLQHIQKDMIPLIMKELCRVSRGWVLVTYNVPAPLRVHRKLSKPKNTITTSEFSQITGMAGLEIVRTSALFPMISANRFALLKKVSMDNPGE